MKMFIILAAILSGLGAEARTNYNVYRMPSTGSLPGWGPIDISQSGAVTGTLANANTTAASTNTSSTIVLRDGSGNFSCGTITGALSGNASTSTALAANPTDCGANTFATTIDASGNLTCAAVSLTAAVSGILPVANGGTGVNTLTSGNILTGNGTGAITSITTVPVANGGTGANTLTSGNILTGNGTGAITSIATVPVTQGGTGLGTLTANNVILGNGTSNPTFVAPGSSGNVLTSNGTTWASAAAAGSTSSSSSYELTNLGLAASVSANLLTVSLKDSSGSAPSGGSPVKIGVRDGTSATGQYTQLTVNAALSVSSASTSATLGLISGSIAQYIYVYAINNAGTVELGLSGSGYLDQGKVITTFALNAASTNINRMYTTAARSNVACRLIGRLLVTEATAGTMASAPTEISVAPFREGSPRSEIRMSQSNGYGSTANKIMRFTTQDVDRGGVDLTLTQDSVNGDSITVNTEGLYTVSLGGSNGVTAGVTVNAASLTTSINNALTYADGFRGASNFGPGSTSITLYCYPGDVLRYQTDGAASSNVNNTYWDVLKIK